MPRDVRAVPRALVVAAALLLVARVGAEVYEHAHPPAWADLVHWKTPAEAAEILAMESRPALYDFSASWCEPCQLMRQELFSDEATASLIDAFVPVRVDDDDHSAAAQAIRARFVTVSLPTLIITGSLLPTPLVMAGYPGREKTVAFLKDGLGKATKLLVQGHIEVAP